ncbi:MAG: hypothetical protein ACOC1K_02055 [Nanoarchaeota archaeon]
MERFYRTRDVDDNLSFEDTYIPVDSKGWRTIRSISLDRLGNSLQLKFNENLFDRNITSIKIDKQEENPSLPPKGSSYVERTYISVDDNYLYIWIPNLKRWKRIMLSSWD